MASRRISRTHSLLPLQATAKVRLLQKQWCKCCCVVAFIQGEYHAQQHATLNLRDKQASIDAKLRLQIGVLPECTAGGDVPAKAMDLTTGPVSN